MWVTWSSKMFVKCLFIALIYRGTHINYCHFYNTNIEHLGCYLV